MRLGIFARTFPGTDPDAVLGAVRAAGYDTAQFNLACAGLASLPDAVPEATLAGIAAAASRHDVALVALSGTYNMIHPDPAVRAAGLRRLPVVLRAASQLGIGLVTLCTGTRDAQDMWRHHPDNAGTAAWDDLCREMQAALALAEAAGVTLAIEPEMANVVATAADAARLIGDCGSARLGVVLDPANLFERADRGTARSLVAAAVERLAGHVVLAHAKDRDATGAVVAAGRGVVDFPDFVARLRRSGFDGALVTHGLAPEQAPGVAAFLRPLL